MSNDKTIILGNGLSALIWAIYHPNSILIGPGRPGGMAKDMKAPMLLHDHPATKSMLKKLGLSTKTRKVKVGYGYNDLGKVIIREDPPQGFRESYYRHSRCLYEWDLDLMSNSVMNQGRKKFKAFTITPDTLINSLIEAIINTKGIFINDTIQKMSVNNWGINICGNRINDTYDNIISTIPMKNFLSLFSDKGNERITPDHMLTKIFLEGYKQPPSILEYDFIYLIPHPKNPAPYSFMSNITRINNNSITGKTFFEYTFIAEDPAIEKLMVELIEVYERDKVSLYPGISVRKDIGWKKYYGIKFLGRGACWDHSIKVQNVVMEAQKDAIQ